MSSSSSESSGEGRTIDLFSTEGGSNTTYDYYIDVDEKVIKYNRSSMSYGSDYGTIFEFKNALDRRIIESLINLVEPYYGNIKREHKRY